MPTILTAEQIKEIKRIIEKHHTAVVAKVVGVDVLSDEEKETLKEAGIDPTSIESIKDSYLYGQALSQAGQIASMSYEKFQSWIQKNPVPLSDAEERAVEAAKQRAGEYIRHLGAKVVIQANQMVFEEDSRLRSEILETVRDKVAENIAKRESVGKLKSELGHAVGDWSRDWNRVAVTEKHNAMQQGVADGIRKKFGGGSLVFKRPMPDACKHCKRLHLGPDGLPRVFKLKDLEANGSNVGRKAADWRAVVGATHPWCSCQLFYVPSGWGFDEDGTLIPGGKLGQVFESPDELKASLVAEDELQKGTAVKGTIDFQGLKIAIENPAGSIRYWTAENGEKGQTTMLYAYGYVKGTRGARQEGMDEYDVFVGPDPNAQFAYVVHQMKRPEFKAWDEDKAMIGFSNHHQAKQAYLAHYDDPRFFGSMTILPMEEFIEKVKRTKMSIEDGMIKTLDPNLAAAGSAMGARNIRHGVGTNIAMGYARGLYDPESHRHTANQFADRGVIIPVAAFRGGRAEDPTDGMVRKDKEDYYLEATMLPARHDFEIPQQYIHLIEMGLDPKEAKKQKEIIEESYKRWYEEHVFENPADPEKQTKGKDPVPRRANKSDVALVIDLEKAGPFIGPRGGKWADAKHTIPWKPFKPKPKKRTPARRPAVMRGKNTPPRKWQKDYYPPNFPRPDFTTWERGKRGGTEALHWDEKRGDFTPERKALHEKIFKDALDKGSSPEKGQKPLAIITMGHPASGKSTTLAQFVQDPAMVRIDSDSIKEELPEYRAAVAAGYMGAASMVHAESTSLVEDLRERAVAENKHLIFDSTGADLGRFIPQIQKLKKAGYEVVLVMPHVMDVDAAVKRANDRAEETGRLVPEDVVRRLHDEVPGNFATIASLCDHAQLYDSSDPPPPNLLYSKVEGEHTVHDPGRIQAFSGLADLASKGETDVAGIHAVLQEAMIKLIEQQKEATKQEGFDVKKGRVFDEPYEPIDALTVETIKPGKKQ